VSAKSLLAGLGLAVLATVSVPSTIAEANSSTSCWRFKPAERAFALRMNAARDGLPKLRLDRHLSKVARAHNRAMTRRRALFHSSRRQLGRRVTNWSILGENVGFGSGVSQLHRAFMSSAGHRANIQGPHFRHVGVAVRRRHGQMWVTVLFESRANPGTTMSMPSC
jgi:uncharacterized protein YkwD